MTAVLSRTYFLFRNTRVRSVHSRKIVYHNNEKKFEKIFLRHLSFLKKPIIIYIGLVDGNF